MAASQICVYCIDLLTTGFHCCSLQDRLWFFCQQDLFGSKKRCSPQNKKQVLDVVRFHGKAHLVDKKCTETQQRCAACGKCTKFVSKKCHVDLHPDKRFVEYHGQTTWWCARCILRRNNFVTWICTCVLFAELCNMTNPR